MMNADDEVEVLGNCCMQRYTQFEALNGDKNDQRIIKNPVCSCLELHIFLLNENDAFGLIKAN